MIKKGRKADCFGLNNGNVKLTQKQVDRIRELYKTGNYYQWELGKKYGVWQGQIGKIINYKSWKILSKGSKERGVL